MSISNWELKDIIFKSVDMCIDFPRYIIIKFYSINWHDCAVIFPNASRSILSFDTINNSHVSPVFKLYRPQFAPPATHFFGIQAAAFCLPHIPCAHIFSPTNLLYNWRLHVGCRKSEAPLFRVRFQIWMSLVPERSWETSATLVHLETLLVRAISASLPILDIQI